MLLHVLIVGLVGFITAICGFSVLRDWEAWAAIIIAAILVFNFIPVK